jgi:hypothetical protein
MQEIKVPELYNTLKEWTIQIISREPLLQSFKKIILIPEDKDNGSQTLKRISLLDLTNSYRLWKVISILEKDPEFKIFIDEIKQKDEIMHLLPEGAEASISSANKDKGFAIDYYYSMFSFDYINELLEEQQVNGEFKKEFWDEKKFIELYKIFEDTTLNKYRTMEFWMPLYNVNLSKEITIKENLLEDDVFLSKPGLKEKISLNLFAPDPENFPVADSLFGFQKHNTFEKYFLKIACKIKIGEALIFDKLLLDRWILSINIATNGEVKCNKAIPVFRRGEVHTIPTFKTPDSTSVGQIFPITIYPFEAMHSRMFDIILIKQEDIKNIILYGKTLKSLEKDYQIPISRYLTANFRSKPQDVLIDAVITLESLLLYNIEDELSFRLAHRGSWILYKNANPEKRKYIFKKLRDIYKVRSTIVHGSDDKKQLYHLATSLVANGNDALQIIRELFRIILDNNYNKHSWDEELKKADIVDYY